MLPDWEFLESLAGVGHKTASVVMAQAFGVPAFPVDTHIHRLAARWGLSNGTTVERTERDLKAVFPTRDVERPPPADHLLRPRVLPGPAPRLHRLPDLLVRSHQEARSAEANGYPNARRNLTAERIERRVDAATCDRTRVGQVGERRSAARRRARGAGEQLAASRNPWSSSSSSTRSQRSRQSAQR